MKRVHYAGVALLLFVSLSTSGIAQGSHPKLWAAKVFLGSCDSNCSSNSTAQWIPGSTIRWRVGVANVGNSQVTQCVITDMLPPGFTYAGNERYYYGSVGSQLNVSFPACCSLVETLPSIITGGLTKPSVGAGNLEWTFPMLPGLSQGQIEYFIIDFDVDVGTVVPGNYCNSFTFSATIPSATDGIPSIILTTTSNIAQVTISDGVTGVSLNRENNPYLTGESGNWYPTKTWSYLTNRQRGVGVSGHQTNIRVDGAFNTYKNFWRHPAGSARWYQETDGWQWVETITKKDVNGLTLETSDVLGRHNALLTGYKKRLVVAEVGNARINEILFEGFEDWDYVPIAAYCDTDSGCVPGIVDWDRVFALDANQSHTGRYSGRLIGSGKSITIPVVPTPPSVQLETSSGSLALNHSSMPVVSPSPVPEERERLDSLQQVCAGRFTPTADMKYVFSAWVRDDFDPLATSYDNPTVQIGLSQFRTRGNIIDGWQQIYGEFFIPPGSVSISLKFTQGFGNTWFDDIRIFPFDATLATYVYDANTLKLTYTSDENNYFTKYNYDAADNLESINKETEKGVQTVKEARSATVKLP